ncbi:MAG: hypothetical protein DBX97_04290 [Collinsella tanakaei]|nr:MAG: hypothetical protein DBX97_04290 [Collinsella tanakaei]
MKLYELLDEVEIQSDMKIVYYNYKKEKRIEITEKQAKNKTIRYLYSENDILFIEVEKEF